MRMNSGWVRALCAAALVLVSSATSFANGRYPRAQILKLHNDDLVFVSTFGMMVSADRGKSWYFVCERAIFGEQVNLLETIDLFLERGSDGSILSGSSNRGMRRSTNQGCTFELQDTLPVPSEFRQGAQPPGYVIDLSAERSKSPSAFIAIAGVTGESSPATQRYQLYETLDNGRNFKPHGPPIPTTEVGTVYTIDVAPQDALLLYMTVRPPQEDQEDQLWVSHNGGESWPERYNIPYSRERAGDGSFLTAIHPKNPKILFLRAQHWSFDPAKTVDDSTLVSTDGGKTWTDVLRKRAKPLGFALSPDGNTVLIGIGNHGAPPEISQPEDNGIYKASLDNLNFERITWDSESEEGTLSVGCLTWNEQGLFVCASPADDPFTIGFRPDADFTPSDPMPFTPLLIENEVKGPLPWTGRDGDVCIHEWLLGASQLPNGGLCEIFRQCPEGDAGVTRGPGPPLCIGVGGGGAGGMGGSSGGAGSNGSGGSASGGTSCGCHLPALGGQSGAIALILGAGVGGAFFGRWRSRRS